MSNEELENKMLKIQLKKKTEQYKEALEDTLILDELKVWLKDRVDKIESNNEFDRFEKLLCMDVLSNSGSSHRRKPARTARQSAQRTRRTASLRSSRPVPGDGAGEPCGKSACRRSF